MEISNLLETTITECGKEVKFICAGEEEGREILVQHGFVQCSSPLHYKKDGCHFRFGHRTKVWTLGNMNKYFFTFAADDEKLHDRFLMVEAKSMYQAREVVSRSGVGMRFAFSYDEENFTSQANEYSRIEISTIDAANSLDGF